MNVPPAMFMAEPGKPIGNEEPMREKREGKRG